MLQLYGWKRSRAIRCMWALEELGLEYEHIPLNPHAGETRTPDYLALNPSGKVPTLVHDGFVLTESMAINLYLASTIPNSLLPRDPQAVAKLHQWNSWALSELEPPVVAIFREGRRPPEAIDQSRIEGWRGDVHKMLETVLEPHLARQANILPGPAFTLADLNVASVVSSLPMVGISLDGHPQVDAWFKRCFARDAWRRVQERP
jgi:glutathione S-transferase